jgi:hypothetical protein
MAAECARLREALTYYASADVYEPRVTLAGERSAGVMKDRGRKARIALANRK